MNCNVSENCVTNGNFSKVLNKLDKPRIVFYGLCFETLLHFMKAFLTDDGLCRIPLGRI